MGRAGLLTSWQVGGGAGETSRWPAGLVSLPHCLAHCLLDLCPAAVLAEERGAGQHQQSDPTETMPFPDALLQAGWVAAVGHRRLQWPVQCLLLECAGGWGQRHAG